VTQNKSKEGRERIVADAKVVQEGGKSSIFERNKKPRSLAQTKKGGLIPDVAKERMLLKRRRKGGHALMGDTQKENRSSGRVCKKRGRNFHLFVFIPGSTVEKCKRTFR